jgi:hypothetical protein
MPPDVIRDWEDAIDRKPKEARKGARATIAVIKIMVAGEVKPLTLLFDRQGYEVFVHLRVFRVEVANQRPNVFTIRKLYTAPNDLPRQCGDRKALDRPHGSVVACVVVGVLPHWISLQVRNLE